MKKCKSIHAFLCIFSSTLFIAISIIILFSCGSGVDVGPLTIYTLTVTSDAYGTTDPSGSIKVSHGQATPIQATPGQVIGYNTEFDEWTVVTGSGVTFGNSGLSNTDLPPKN